MGTLHYSDYTIILYCFGTLQMFENEMTELHGLKIVILF